MPRRRHVALTAGARSVRRDGGHPPCYCETYVPTLLHHLGFRVVDIDAHSASTGTCAGTTRSPPRGERSSPVRPRAPSSCTRSRTRGVRQLRAAAGARRAERRSVTSAKRSHDGAAERPRRLGAGNQRRPDDTGPCPRTITSRGVRLPIRLYASKHVHRLVPAPRRARARRLDRAGRAPAAQPRGAADAEWFMRELLLHTSAPPRRTALAEEWLKESHACASCSGGRGRSSAPDPRRRALVGRATDERGCVICSATSWRRGPSRRSSPPGLQHHSVASPHYWKRCRPATRAWRPFTAAGSTARSRPAASAPGPRPTPARPAARALGAGESIAIAFDVRAGPRHRSWGRTIALGGGRRRCLSRPRRACCRSCPSGTARVWTSECPASGSGRPRRGGSLRLAIARCSSTSWSPARRPWSFPGYRHHWSMRFRFRVQRSRASSLRSYRRRQIWRFLVESGCGAESATQRIPSAIHAWIAAATRCALSSMIVKWSPATDTSVWASSHFAPQLTTIVMPGRAVDAWTRNVGSSVSAGAHSASSPG